MTLSDRDWLLQTLAEFGEQPASVDELLQASEDWSLRLNTNHGVERAMLTHLTQIANHLRLHPDDPEISLIARGAIRFLVSNEAVKERFESQDDEPDGQLEWFEMRSKAFIASYAASEIAARLGEPATFHPPAITDEERLLAEAIFERLSAAEGCDERLISNVRQEIDQTETMTRSGFMRRLKLNAEALVKVLENPQRSDDDKTCARGALRYLVEDEDAINDNLGLVGYLDDLFILQTAVDLISPVREPLIELLDRVVGVWPFLNMFSLDDGGGSRAASEFAIINAALSCKQLQSNDAINTVLISPETGSIATVVGLVAALGMAHEAGLRELCEETFVPGQKVLVDYEAVAEFDGFESVEGRRRFRLRGQSTDRGQRLGAIHSWPISDLHRLVPVNHKRVVRGEIGRRKRNERTRLSSLDILFCGPNRADLHAISKQIVVVTPTTVAAEFCKSTLLHDQPVQDVVPVGQIAADGEETASWSSRFGTQKPVLLFASDLDVACSYVQDHREDIEIVIIDATGRNREKHASIKRLNHLKVPCLFVSSERVANETELAEHDDLSVWEWSSDDLDAVIWPETSSGAGESQIATFEARIKSTSVVKPTVEAVKLPIVDATYAAFCTLQRLARQRYPERLPSLDEIVTQGFFATTRLMRCCTELTPESSSIFEVRKRVDAMSANADSSNFLSDTERSAVFKLVAQITTLQTELLHENPKHSALRQLIKTHPGIAIYYPDNRLLSSLTKQLSDSPNRVISTLSPDETFPDGLLIPGWFKRSRMAAALSPPIANPMVLILYDCERRWHRQFADHRTTVRNERRRLKGRTAIFPKITGWIKPPEDAPPTESEVADVEDIEVTQAEIDEGFRNRVYDRVSAGEADADTKARLILFAGGIYGLFTDNYRLNVVTHLLDANDNNNDEKAAVRLTAAKDVGIGDKIVFRPKSRDLIKEVADELIEEGQRELSGLWRSALRSFMDQHHVLDDAMCSKLQSAGCKSQSQAIGNWIHDDDMIAPQQYRTDVPIIAQVTADNELTDKLDQVIEAIRCVRSAHQQKAPRVIAQRIRQKAATIVRHEAVEESVVQLGDDLLLVSVAEKASKPVPVKYTMANRLMEDEAWHE